MDGTAQSPNPPLVTLDDHWQEFRRTVIARDASTAQQLDMKRAFFGGALALYHLQTRNFSGGDSPETDQQLMQLWLGEMESFIDQDNPDRSGSQ